MIIRRNQESFYYYIYSQLRRVDLHVSLDEQNTFPRRTIHNSMKCTAQCTWLLSSTVDSAEKSELFGKNVEIEKRNLLVCILRSDYPRIAQKSNYHVTKHNTSI